jgi:mRNA-degrading endonuclease toxin of MazEF toxin-antitoxin module
VNTPIRRGGVFWVKDDALTLPPADNRNFHDRRTVIVVSGDATNQDPDWPVILVIPTSTSTSFKTEYCVKLAAGVGNLQKKCWARVPCPQPILKTDLVDHTGQLPPDALDLLDRGLLNYMGLLD